MPASATSTSSAQHGVAQAVKPRISWEAFQKSARDVVATMRLMNDIIYAGGISKDLVELISIRASQINTCTFCLSMHTALARKAGVTDQKINALESWRGTNLFTPREAAALEWTEALTLVNERKADDALFHHVAAVFTEEEMMFLSAAIAKINFWNRIAEPFAFAPL